MDILHDPVKRGLAQRLHTALGAIGVEENLETIYGAFGATPNIELGHLAFPCFKYAKALRLGPPQVAAQLMAQLPADELIAELRPAGPYLNIFLQRNALGKLVGEAVLDGSMFHRTLTQDTPRTMIEYSQPNTHKEVHVGHMRNMALGDALIRILRYAGYDIVSTTFPGDVGTHVAKCLWYLKQVNTKPVPAENRGEWLGTMYVGASVLLDELEKAGTDEEAKAAITLILKELEAGSGPYYDLWKETREWSIELMKKVYDWAKIKFDVWYWESDVDSTSVAYTKQLLAEGKLIESDGAVGMDLSEYNLGFAMLLKRDGTGLYATKDIELARRKFEDYRIEKSIYIVDNRQAHHFNQVFKVLELLGFKQAKESYHLAYEHVSGIEGAFSSRKGNAPPVLPLAETMRSTVKAKFLQPQIDKGEMTEDEANVIADEITLGAIKYGMIRIDPNKGIVFKEKEWLSLEGDTGAYLQYTYARIQSLCRKQGYSTGAQIDWSLLDDPREAELLVLLSDFNDVVLRAAAQYRPNIVCAYLYSLAQLYNNVNNAIIIRDISDPLQKSTRLALHMAVAITLREALALLGVPVPDRM
jgi:arginyl-tRNA synthetase